MIHQMTCGLRVLLLVLLGLLVPVAVSVAADNSAAEQAQRQRAQPGNNAPIWREVRKGDNPYQTTQVRGIETQVLIQPDGDTWRRIRNGMLTPIGGVVLVVMILLIYGYFRWKGPMVLHDAPTGRLIERFSDWERLVHWTTAISFLILAGSGVIMLFGKYIFLPLLGHTFFSWFAVLGKHLHNLVGPLFILCTLAMFVTFVKDNLWRVIDFTWLVKAGGLLNGEHVQSGRFNAGEKLWFWFGVILLGLVSGASGLVLDFPNFQQVRAVMQTANLIHLSSGILFIALALSHIYIGTIGAKGAYQSMRHGVVDESWAREHHEVWYEEVKAGKATQRFVDNVPAEVKSEVAAALKT